MAHLRASHQYGILMVRFGDGPRSAERKTVMKRIKVTGSVVITATDEAEAREYVTRWDQEGGVGITNVEVIGEVPSWRGFTVTDAEAEAIGNLLATLRGEPAQAEEVATA